ncbi:flagellar hook-associated protein FlgL [Sodalis ligni]|jgi:flagellar hook-associated protein 3 FlgL|uniref:Flagellar hook-associated protein 3 FlgL n=1 Tax=Sodalis ligni TaxID=2697027 RepID=A0A4R1N595_9GAMM|nr:flagellar hook-associated protein FlgL [Sodalis ligni]TCL02263.1 flagellar hook-associated protein 3 FlgL [Sodalis ligni]
MRLSTSTIYQQNLDGITNGYSKWQATGVQLSTGNRVNKPSDDPIAASQAVGLNQVQALGDQYSAARTTANASLSLESSVLDQMTDVIQKTQTLIVQAGDGTLSDSDRQSLATTLQSYKDQLLTLGNTKDSNGNYLFAGYSTGSQPFVEDPDSGAVTYVGGSEALSQQVDSSRTMTIGDTGGSVLDSLSAGYTPEPADSDGTVPPSEANVFNTIDSVLTALKTPQEDADATTTAAYSATLAKASRGMANSLNNVATVQSSVGTKLNELDTLDSVATDRSTIYQTQIGNLTGVDWYQAISDYSMQQAALQASYSTFNAMKQLSLFQMNS